MPFPIKQGKIGEGKTHFLINIDIHLLNFILMTEKLKLSLLLSGNYLSEKL